MPLSPRLEAVLAMIPAGSRVLDVGTDHALLPIALLQRGIANWAVGGELRPAPLARASENRRAAGLEGQLELRQGDGLRTVAPGEVDVAVLAGMGGQLIQRLLEAAPEIRSSIRRLVLAPNSHAAELRGWLAAQGYEFVAENLVQEGRHLYPVIAVERMSGARGTLTLTLAEEELGPLVLRQSHPLLTELARRVLQRDRAALVELADRYPERRAELERRVRALEEVLQCWPKWPI